MSKSTILQLGMMAVSICIVFVILGGVSMLLGGNPMGGLLSIIVLLPILSALYVTFDHVRRQLEPTKSQVSDVSVTPWESDPGHTEESSSSS